MIDHTYRQRFKIYPTPRQAFLLEDWSRACTRVWNDALEQRRTFYTGYTAHEADDETWHLARRRAGDPGITLSSGRSAPIYVPGLPKRTAILSTQDQPIEGQVRQLQEARREFDWLSAVPAQITNSVLYRMDKAYQAAWRRIREGRPAGFPRFGASRRIRIALPSYDQTHRLIRHAAPDGYAGRIRVCGGMGLLRIRCDRQLDGLDLGEMTLWEQAGQWWGSIVVRSEIPTPTPEEGGSCGINRGLRNLLTVVDEDGSHTVPLETVPEGQTRRLVHLERKAARQHVTNNRANMAKDGRMLPGHKRVTSNREAQTRQQIARMRAAQAATRLERLHVIANELLDHYQIICIEGAMAKGVIRATARDVQPKDRARNRQRLIHEACWGKLAEILNYKAPLRGRVLVQVDPKRINACSECGVYSPSESSILRCPKCGTTLDGDVNAARNVLGYGLAMIERERSGAGGNPGSARRC